MKDTLSPALSLKGEGVEYRSLDSLPLQGEGKGGGVTRNASSKTMRHAKSLRQGMTEVEQKLWYHLRAKRFSHYKFRRQHPLGHYIVDFVCLKSHLIIELDGGQHGETLSYDQTRTAFLESKGFRVLRFWNNEVLENMNAILLQILDTLSPALSLKGEGAEYRSLNSLPLQGEGKGGGTL